MVGTRLLCFLCRQCHYGADLGPSCRPARQKTYGDSLKSPSLLELSPLRHCPDAGTARRRTPCARLQCRPLAYGSRHHVRLRAACTLGALSRHHARRPDGGRRHRPPPRRYACRILRHETVFFRRRSRTLSKLFDVHLHHQRTASNKTESKRKHRQKTSFPSFLASDTPSPHRRASRANGHPHPSAHHHNIHCLTCRKFAKPRLCFRPRLFSRRHRWSNSGTGLGSFRATSRLHPFHDVCTRLCRCRNHIPGNS